VKAVTADTFVIKRPRQGECIVYPWVLAMEGGVETGSLQGRRKGRARRFDPGKIMWLVQRRQRLKRLQIRNHGVRQL